MPYVAILNFPGCLPEAEPVTVDTLQEAVEYVRSEIDRALDEQHDAEAEQSEIEEWESALAHIESYRDGAGDLPYVALPDNYVWTVSEAPEPETSYFTFGVGHSHVVDGVTYDCDVVVKVTDPDPRAVMLRLFGREWAFEYREDPTVDSPYFPRGVVEL